MSKLKKIFFIILGIVLIPNLVFADNSTVDNKARCIIDNGNVFMGGEYIELGISKRGSFGALSNAPESFHVLNSKNTIGLSINKYGYSSKKSPSTGDFILPGNPDERLVIGYIKGESKDGELNEITIAEKNGIVDFDIPIKDLSTTCNCDFLEGKLQSITTGISKDNLKITIINEFNNDDKYFKTSVELENLSDEVLSEVRYMRTFNPDQDYDIHGTYKTLNKIISNPKPKYTNNMYAMVVAKGKQSNDSFFYISNDSRARTAIFSTVPGSIYNDDVWIENNLDIVSTPLKENILTDEGYIESDSYIAITFNLDTIEPKQKVDFSYYSSLNENLIDSLQDIQTMQFISKDIKIKNYPKTSNKQDELIIKGVNINNIIEIYSDPFGKNKILNIKVKDEQLKKDTLIYKLDKDFLTDDKGVMYLSVIDDSTGEKSNLITYNYDSTKDTTLKLMIPRLIYICIILSILFIIYYLYKKKK